MAQCGTSGGKIVSCCYCGVQSRFLPGSGRGSSPVSVLMCGTCGAPLAAQKARPLQPGKGACLVTPAGGAATKAKPKVKKTKSAAGFGGRQKPVKAKSRKKAKGLFHKLVSEAVDLVEDIFD
jgi:hypothetical protein